MSYTLMDEPGLNDGASRDKNPQNGPLSLDQGFTLITLLGAPKPFSPRRETVNPAGFYYSEESEETDMSKLLKVYAPDDLAEVIVREADAEQMSISSYVSAVMADSLQDVMNSTKSATEDEPDNSEDTYHFLFNGEDATILRNKAAKAGVTPIAYLRQLVRTNELKMLGFSTEDLQAFFYDFHKISIAISSMYELIKTEGKGKVFKQDLQRINDNLEMLKESTNKLTGVIYNDRKRMFNEMMDAARKEFQ